MNHKCSLDSDVFESTCHDRAQVFIENAENLSLGEGGIGQGPENVEDTADADLPPGPDNVAHGAMKGGSEEKAYASLADAVGHPASLHLCVHPQFPQHVS
jgi:hypothetical protein